MPFYFLGFCMKTSFSLKAHRLCLPVLHNVPCKSSIFSHCAWHRVDPFSLGNQATQFGNFLRLFFKIISSLHFSVFSYSCFWLLNFLGVSFNIYLSSFLVYDYVFTLQELFVPLNVLFFLLITSCYFMDSKILSFWKEFAHLFPSSHLSFSFPNLIPFSSKLPFSACFACQPPTPSPSPRHPSIRGLLCLAVGFLLMF